jgi:hypothetical protein
MIDEGTVGKKFRKVLSEEVIIELSKRRNGYLDIQKSVGTFGEDPNDMSPKFGIDMSPKFGIDMSPRK